MRVRRGLLPLGITAAVVVAVTACTSTPTAPTASPRDTPAATASPTPTDFDAPGRPVVVGIGDSIMNGHGLEDSQDWPSLLAVDRDDTVYNLACDGGGFIAVGSCGTSFAGLIPDAVKQNPDIVLVQGSDNDHAQSEPALTAATNAMIAQLHKELPHAQIVGINTLWNQPTSAPDEIAYSSRAVRDAVGSVGGTFIDIGQPLQGHDDLLQDDNEHPTAAGQEVLMEKVKDACDAAGVPI
jgi:lysophospholipase L1-like esterase